KNGASVACPTIDRDLLDGAKAQLSSHHISEGAARIAGAHAAGVDLEVELPAREPEVSLQAEGLLHPESAPALARPSKETGIGMGGSGRREALVDKVEAAGAAGLRGGSPGEVEIDFGHEASSNGFRRLLGRVGIVGFFLGLLLGLLFLPNGLQNVEGESG